MKYVFNQICAGLVLALYCSDFVVAADFSRAIMAGRERLDYYLERSESSRDGEVWLEKARQAERAAIAEWEICSLVLKESNSDIYEEEKVKASNYFNSIVQEKYADFIRCRDRAELLNASVIELKQQLENLTAGLEGDWETNARKLFESYLINCIDDDDPEFISRLSLEYEELARIQGNSYLQKNLYDHDSLKAKSNESSAMTIAEMISNNAFAETTASVDEIHSQLDKSINAQGEVVKVDVGEDWNLRFQEELEKSLSAWNKAEEEFLMSRSKWFENSEREYEIAFENWNKAYESLLTQKSLWDKQITESIQKAYVDSQEGMSSFSSTVETSIENYRQRLDDRLSGIQQCYEMTRDVYTETRSLLSQCKTGIETWNRQWGDKYSSVYEFALDNGMVDTCSILEKVLNDKIDLNDIDDSFIEEFRKEISDFKDLSINYYMGLIDNQFVEYDSKLAEIEEKLSEQLKKGVVFGSTVIYSRKSRQIMENLNKEKELVLAERNSLVEATSNLETDLHETDSVDERIGLVESNCSELMKRDGYFSLSSVYLNCFDEIIYWMDKTIDYREKERAAFDSIIELARDVNSQRHVTQKDVQIEKAEIDLKEKEVEYLIAKAVADYANGGKERESASEMENKLKDALYAYEVAKISYDNYGKTVEEKNSEKRKNAELEIEDALKKVEDAESQLEKLQQQYELELTAFKSRKQEKDKLESFYTNSLNQLKDTIADCALCDAFDFYNAALEEFAADKDGIAPIYENIHHLLFEKENLDFSDFAKAVIEAQKIGNCNVDAVEYVIKLVCMETILAKETRETSLAGLKEIQEKMNQAGSINEEDDFETREQKSLEYLALSYENKYWELANELFEDDLFQWDASNNYENINNAIDLAFLNIEDLFIPFDPENEKDIKVYNRKVTEANVDSCLGKMNVYKIKLENLDNGNLENEMEELLLKEREVTGRIIDLRNDYYAKISDLQEIDRAYEDDIANLNLQYDELCDLLLDYRKALAVYDYASNIYLKSDSIMDRLERAESLYLEAKENFLNIKDSDDDIPDDSEINNIKLVEEYEKDAYLASILLYETMDALSEEQAKVNKAKATYDSAFHDITESDDEQKIIWLQSINENQQYFEDVVLAALYSAAINGELDDVHGVNMNPLSSENTVYVLSNVDSKDELNSKRKYLRFRIEQLEASYQRVKESGNPDWSNDIKNCMEMRNENSLFADLLASLEKNLLNYRCYEELRKEYKDIKENHSFARGIFGDTFMDGTGRAGQASEAIIKQMKEQVNSLIAENKLMVDNLVENYEREKDNYSTQSELYENILQLTDGTYGDAAAQVMKLLGNDSRLSQNEIDGILNKYGEKSDEKVLDFILAVYEFYEDRLDKVKNVSLADKYGDLYQNAIKQDSRIDINTDVEWYLIQEINQYINSLLSGLEKENELEIERYANQLDGDLRKSKTLYDNKIQDLQKTLIIANEEWEKAQQEFISSFNLWKTTTEVKRKEIEEAWQNNYENFLVQREDMLNESYMNQYLAAGVKNMDSDCSDERICRLVESAKELGKVQYVDYENSIDSALNMSFGERIDEYLESRELMSASGWNVSKKTYVSNSAVYYAKQLKNSMDWILEEQKNIASRNAASQAYEVSESLRQKGLEKIVSENKIQKDYEMNLVRSQGYAIDGNSIMRTIARGATLFGLTYQTQSVHMYRNYSAEAVKYSTDFNSLSNLSEASISRIVAITFDEYAQWEERIFGTETQDGEFGRYLGDVPELKKQVDIQNGRKEDSFDYKIMGENTLILMDLTWNSLKADEAYEEIALPAWDKKVFDASWAPTIRTTAAIAAAVAGSVVTAGTASGAAAVMASAAISSGITMANELAFAALDYGYGYKTLDEIGKSLGTSMVSNGIGILTAGAGTAVANIGNTSQRVFAKVAVNGTGAAAKTVSSALINYGWNMDSLGEFSNWSDALSSMASTAVSSGLEEWNLGNDFGKVKGFSSGNIDSIKSMNSMIGSLAGTSVEYGITGNAKFNIARVKNTGIFEIGIGDEGFNAGFGTDGMDLSLGSLISSLQGASAVSKNSRINDFANGDSVIGQALRMQYGYGNSDAKKQLEELLNGKTIMDAFDGGESIAKTVNDSGLRTILIKNLDSMEGMELGLILQHEAERNGSDDGLIGQIFETIDSVAAHTLMAMEVISDDLYTDEVKTYMAQNPDLASDIEHLIMSLQSGQFEDFANYAISNYDFSNDYWKLKSGGQLVYDKQGYLMDEDGYYLNAKGEKSDKIEGDTLGSVGIETGLLNILHNTINKEYESFSNSEILLAQKIMMDSGIKPSNTEKGFKDYTWKNNYLGIKINMDELMQLAGKSISNVVTDAYYNNTADIEIANSLGVDLGFESGKHVYENSYEKYRSLILKKRAEGLTAAEIKDKYKFTYTDADGNVTEFFKLNENNPFLDKLLGQHDFRDINSVIDHGACNFMAILAVPQLMTGNVLNEDDFLEVWNSSIENGLVDKSDATVMNRDNFLKNMFERISGVESSFMIGDSDNDIIGKRIGFIDGNGSLYHFALGSTDGKVIYNPGNGTSYKRINNNITMR